MRVDELAIFSGHPAFSEKVHVGRPNLLNREALLRRIEDILDRHWFTNNGVYVQEFEARIAKLVGVKNCIATCNATIGLELATRALGFHGEAIVPAFTFIATAHALQWQGITPVFCDIEPRKHHIDPAKIEELITPTTSGILAVHLWGRACDVESLSEIARRHRLPLVFDAAHAFGVTHGGKPVGGFGDAEVFSFHATKFVNSFEGGAITTNDDALASRLRLMRNFGFADYDRVVAEGGNGKMTEVCAAMGLTSIDEMDLIVRRNRSNFERYAIGLGGIPGVALRLYDPAERSNYQYVVLEVDAAEAGLDRDTLKDALWAENVLARRYFYPGCHRAEPYRAAWAERPLPVTDRVAERVLVLPTGTGVDDAAIDKICDMVATAVRHAPEVRRRLNR